MAGPEPPAYLLDHVSLPVTDLAAARAFYAAALEPLGFGIVAEPDGAVGLGAPGLIQDLWLYEGAAGTAIHLAFHARDEAAVRAFHAAALAAGGVDNGPPGPRPQYHAGYYGAYVFDPDGNNVEAVFHGEA
jgi:catechol 2,3-dioxygenase-like lactoylglutathione lyase family enzyme